MPGGLNLDPSALSGLLTQGTSQFSTLFNGGGFGGLPGLPSGGGLGSLPSLPGGTGGSGGLLGGIGGLTGGGGGLGQISSLTPNKNFLPNANPSGSVGNKEAAKQSLLEQLNVGGH